MNIASLLPIVKQTGEKKPVFFAECGNELEKILERHYCNYAVPELHKNASCQLKQVQLWMKNMDFRL